MICNREVKGNCAKSFDTLNAQKKNRTFEPHLQHLNGVILCAGQQVASQCQTSIQTFHAFKQSKQTPLSVCTPTSDSLFAPALALCFRSIMNLAIHLMKNETLLIVIRI